MTDLQKYKDLLDSLHVSYVEKTFKDRPGQILIFIETEIDDKVVGYGGFYCYWTFMQDTGEFIQIGIYE